MNVRENGRAIFLFGNNVSKLAIPETTIEHKTLVYTTIIPAIVKCLQVKVHAMILQNHILLSISEQTMKVYKTI